MVQRVSRAEFARRARCQRPTITQAVHAGRLVSLDGLIDVDDPRNRRYLELRQNSTPATGPHGAGRPFIGGASPPVPQSEIASDETSPSPVLPSRLGPSDATDAAGQGRQLDNRLKAVKLARQKLQYVAEMKSVIACVQVDRALSRLSSGLDENFHAFGERHGQELHEAAATNDVRAWTALLEKRIDETVRITVETVAREIEVYKYEGPPA